MNNKNRTVQSNWHFADKITTWILNHAKLARAAKKIEKKIWKPLEFSF